MRSFSLFDSSDYICFVNASTTRALVSCWMTRQVIQPHPHFSHQPNKPNSDDKQTFTPVISTRSVSDLYVWMRLCHCSRQFVWVRRISKWCIPPSLSSSCCSLSSPVNLLSMERWRPNTWPMQNTTRWVSVLCSVPQMGFSAVFKMVELVLFCLVVLWLSIHTLIIIIQHWFPCLFLDMMM